ncbi:nucleopolyhedrovirus P10 family protein [Streptomyces sp. NBC_01476]|uniref:nucleopolyhedrovirus P10 family protein n=1 Tax=Streptomyces sp. NBC_01476 TaxID=2903881 RepID=UPI002E319E9E|nr:nucleopolyhedrovirus P10 family protein [Streptomyces sp. NBC_01476]
MTMDRLTRTVREQVALGRLLPLGGPDDPVWITENAAVLALRGAADGMRGVRLRDVDVVLVDAGGAPSVPPAAPVGALPHLPVRIEAEFDAAADEPLPVTAERLRDVLWEAAGPRLGLVVAAVDLQVSGLLDDGPPAPGGPLEGRVLDPEPEPGPALVEPGSAEAVAAAARAVPGVRRLTRRLAGLGPGIRVRDDTAEGRSPSRHVQAQIATGPGHLPLAVARAVAVAIADAAAPGAPGPVTSAVVVTDVG